MTTYFPASSTWSPSPCRVYLPTSEDVHQLPVWRESGKRDDADRPVQVALLSSDGLPIRASYTVRVPPSAPELYPDGATIPDGYGCRLWAVPRCVDASASQRMVQVTVSS